MLMKSLSLSDLQKLKKINFPKRFLFVGRYIKRKGLLDLWESFVQLQEESPNDWELWCVGKGPLYKDRIIHPKIKHFGFVFIVLGLQNSLDFRLFTAYIQRKGAAMPAITRATIS